MADYEYAQADFNSHQEWKGIIPDKFHFPERKHYPPKDLLQTIEGADHVFLGRKHFAPTYSGLARDQLGLKTFPNLQNHRSNEVDWEIPKKSNFTPTVKPYGHRERKHLYQDSLGEYVYSASIKTFYPLKGDNNEAGLENTMGRKKIIDSLEDQRNLIGVRSLGDKAYKNPEYATKFYHERGLVPGSTHQFKTSKKPIVKSLTEQERNRPKGTKWTDRVKKEELDIDVACVKNLHEWEQTSLKEARPSWRDPDEIEFEPPKPQIDQKNVKKPTGKK